MAYNNYFPLGYQPYYQPQVNSMMQQPSGMMQQPQGQTNNSITWVQGEAGAKSYFVAPNTTVQLWDSESQIIYLKSADASGMPSMKILDYTIRDSSAPQQTQIAVGGRPEYVTKEELAEFEDRINQRFDKISASRNRREKKEDEQSTV